MVNLFWGKKRFLRRELMDDRIDHSVPVRVSDGLPGRDVDTFVKGLCGSTSGRTAHHNGVALSAFFWWAVVRFRHRYILERILYQKMPRLSRGDMSILG